MRTGREKICFKTVQIVSQIKIDNEIIKPNEGYYVCIYGELHDFVGESDSDFVLLDFDDKHILINDGRETTPQFQKELTQRISDLIFDMDGAFDGEICLVFLITNAQYQLLRQKDSTEYAMHWRFNRDDCIFGCYYSDIEYK